MRVPMFVTQIDNDVQIREHIFCGIKGVYDVVVVIAIREGGQLDL